MKSLNWEVVKGPFWNEETEEEGSTGSLENEQSGEEGSGYENYFDDFELRK